MKNFKKCLLLFSVIIFLGDAKQCIGQELITLCTEATAKQLQQEGVFVTTKSYEPNYGYWVQYREVIKIEKVGMGAGGGKPWYYFVHFGPESSYKLWPQGASPPWEINKEYWVEKETQGWHGMWYRKGTSNIFDVIWKNGNDTVTATVSFTVKGNKWTGQRTTSSDGVLCQYFGTMSSDGFTIEGNGTCDNGGTFNWNVTVCK